MPQQNLVARRSFLKQSALISLGMAVPAAAWPTAAQARTTAASSPPGDAIAFVDAYRTNLMTDLSVAGNAAVRALSGMQQLWKTGPTWDTGVPIAVEVLHASMRQVARATATRTREQAAEAFIYDRQHQSYAVIAGLGPLAPIYRAGALAVTSITTAPDGIPATKIHDAVPAGAPAGSAIGAGSVTSDLGAVAHLVNTVRGPYASSNPSKYAYQYPRPWRMTPDSRVVPTGEVDALGYPVYETDVQVVTQLLRQRSASPADDGGFPSGHTNAFYLAAIALAYAVPERFQELIARASYLSHTRMIAGMHSPVDVIGGRTLGTALAAAALHDPRNAELKLAARAQAADYFRAQTGSTADTLYAFAHSAPLADDPYADRGANRDLVIPRLTYLLPRSDGHPDGRPDRHGGSGAEVPRGAEVLLETRLPYLDAGQRRDVLRSTAVPAGWALLDGPEQWGRLNLFDAADGFGAFDHDVRVRLDAAAGGFHARDTWRNTISGRGGLTKQGTGTLSLTGDNRFSGGTRVLEGTLVAASRGALGTGDVHVLGGRLHLDPPAHRVTVHGSYLQAAGAVLRLTISASAGPALTVARKASLGRDSVLEIAVDPDDLPVGGHTLQVLRCHALRGSFGTITVLVPGVRAVPAYTGTGLSVRLTTR